MKYISSAMSIFSACKENNNHYLGINLKEKNALSINSQRGENLLYTNVHMCGIFGYKGDQDATRILLHGLERVEYRGYDSAGLVVIGKQGTVKMMKTVGKVSNLSVKVVDFLSTLSESSGRSEYTYGIAHTRWATHGGVTEANCHPHVSNNGKFLIVHNGIIENYLKHKQMLLKQGYTFASDTDTEIIANLLQYHRNGNFLETVQKVTKLLTGAYALLILNLDIPDQMIGVRLGSPLVFGTNTKEEFFFSSDTQALTGYADQVIYLEEGDLLLVDGNDFLIYAAGKPTLRSIEELDQEALQISKGSFKHFMLKEIYEQPNIIRRIYKGRVQFDEKKLTADAFHGMQNQTINDITLVACGTSYHSGRLASLRLETLAGISSRAVIASEYEHRIRQVTDRSLQIFISQSGETADTIACLKLLQEHKAKTFGIVNVPGSTIARLTDSGLFTRAGTEIGVASTKAFTAQCVSLLLLSLFLGKKNGMRITTYQHILQELNQLPMYIETILGQSEYMRSLATHLTGYISLFFLGRGYHVPIAYESALKLKEISYLHAEAYPAGELKHGPLALIDEQTPSILFMPNDEQWERNRSSLHEVKARSGKVLAISDKKVTEADRLFQLPSTCPELMPLLSAVAGQLLAYHIADILQRDIDKPRNLAKSVTVK